MNFQNGGLNETYQAVEILDRDIGLIVLVRRILHLDDLGVDALPGILLEEGLPLDIGWRAQERERSADDMRSDVAPDFAVIIGKSFLVTPSSGQ